MRMFNFLARYRKKDTTNYFDYPAELRKKLIVEAVKRANEMQYALVEEYKKESGRKKRA